MPKRFLRRAAVATALSLTLVALPVVAANAASSAAEPVCSTSIERKKNRILPDEYRVAMTCWSIPAGMEVRAILDLSLAADEHTPWIGPDRVGETVRSPYSRWGTTADSRIQTRLIG